MEVKKIGVIGAGQMGHGIALVAAQAGFEVVLNDIKDEFVQGGLAKIGKFLSKSVEKGKMEASRKEEIRGKIRGAVDLNELADADLIIEAIVENLEIK
ncbi:MAG: 3-hydroxyacyl-CoA dehydrogenase family protein, partial [Thermoplasmatota archaeon]